MNTRFWTLTVSWTALMNSPNPCVWYVPDFLKYFIFSFSFSFRLQQNAPTYPLVSKNALFKAFPKSLSEFLTRLINASDESGVLTPDANDSNPELIPILAAWL